jgi:hypothetical protein
VHKRVRKRTVGVSELSRSRRRWILSSAVVITAYGAVFAGLLWRSPPSRVSAPPAAAMVVEIAAVAASPADGPCGGDGNPGGAQS